MAALTLRDPMESTESAWLPDSDLVDADPPRWSLELVYDDTDELDDLDLEEAVTVRLPAPLRATRWRDYPAALAALAAVLVATFGLGWQLGRQTAPIGHVQTSVATVTAPAE
ncbi:MAG TPA: hypothetical protein VMI75_07565 [Polyangiaceae bacterium]|nr:hypothetical protein [Polyangiaceae bacterium]